MQRFKKILCVMEHGEPSQSALEKAVELAENNQAELMVAAVIPRLPAGLGTTDHNLSRDDLAAAVKQEHEASFVSALRPYRQRLDIRHKLLQGTAFLEVIREVLRDGHDLVIKCPESPSWLDRFFSGDDMHLLRKCPCPVWFVRPQPLKAFQRILAAIDVGDGYPPRELKTRYQLNRQIVDMAASLAVSESAELHLVHAWESVNEMASGIAFSSNVPRQKLAAGIERERQHQRVLLDEFMQDLRDSSQVTRDALDYLRPQMHLLKGDARKEIPDLAKHQAVDCIVMGTVARTGISGFFMGNTAETILEQIDCSVLAIKPQGFVTPVTLDN